METPTPVSALMHAGVINAGGFLIIRFSPILQNSTLAHSILILLGAATAVYGSLVMITQNNIKAKLAFSTISQMGVMLFACGLGAYSIALFHIIAHSFYKAHAFLSTGVLIEESKKVGFKLRPTTPQGTLILGTLGFGIILLGSFAWQGLLHSPLFYGAIMLLALGQNVFKPTEIKLQKSAIVGSIVGILTLGISAYVLIELTISGFLTGIVPNLAASHPLAQSNLLAIILAFGMFIVGFFLSGQIMNPKSPFFRKLYIYFWNAGYSKQISFRWISNFLSHRPHSQGA